MLGYRMELDYDLIKMKMMSTHHYYMPTQCVTIPDSPSSIIIGSVIVAVIVIVHSASCMTSCCIGRLKYLLGVS